MTYAVWELGLQQILSLSQDTTSIFVVCVYQSPPVQSSASSSVDSTDLCNYCSLRHQSCELLPASSAALQPLISQCVYLKKDKASNFTIPFVNSVMVCYVRPDSCHQQTLKKKKKVMQTQLSEEQTEKLTTKLKIVTHFNTTFCLIKVK